LTVPNQNTTSPERVVEILERISDAFVALDRNSCYTYMNKKASEIFNRDPQQMIGKYIWAEFPESSGQPIHLAYEKAMKEQQYVYLEEYFAPNHQWFENHIYPSPEGLSIFFRDITEKKKTEEKLEQSQKRFRALVENNEGIISLVDEKLNVLFRSESAARITGWTNAEIEKTNAAEYIHPDDLEGLKSTMTKAMQKAGENIPIEIRVRHKKGNYICLEGVVKNMTHDPAIGGIITNMRDITEKKKTEEELNKNHAFIESIINASPDIIYIYDIEERKNVFSNDGIQTNLGYTIAEIKEMGHQILPTLMPKEDFDHYLNNTYPQYATLKDKEVLIHEFRMKHKDGSWHWLQTKESVFLRKPDGMPKQIFGITTDITDRKKDEEKLKESEERYRELIEQAADGIILVDENTNIIMANRSMCEMLGYSREEILTLKITDTYPESERHMAAVRLKMAEQTSPLRIERLMLRKNGTTIPVEAIISKTSQGVFQSIVRDITDRKKTEEQLLLSKERFIKIFEKTPYAATLTKADTGIIEEVNEAFERSFGYSRHELIGKTSAEIQFYQTTEDREKMTLLFKQNGFIHNTEVKLFTKVNESRVFIINSDIVDIVGQKYILTVAEDVTEKKKGEEKLQKSEELFSSVFYTSPAGILITRIDDGKIINANDAFLNMFELSREETIGHNSIELNMLSPEERTKLIQQQIISGGLNNFELLSKTRSGKPIYLLFSSRPLEINDEACHITSLIDISERKKAEEALKQSENALKEAQRIAHVGSWVNDLATGKQTWSDETYNIFGVSPENFSLDLDSFFQCIHPDDRALVKESMKSAMAGDPSPEIEYRIVLPDKSIRYLSGRGELKYDEQNKLVLMSGTVQDITERIKAEEEINQTTEQLRQLASHLQTIREEERKRIGREIHDELGQQLTAIKMDLVWVDKKIPREETLLKDKLDNSISLLDQSNLSIRKILNELRMGVLEHTELVDAMLLHAEQFTKNTGIPVEFNISNEQIQGDDIAVACLFRVFQESLTNITRYSEAKKVTVSLKYNEEAIYLSIKDDGKGFDTALLKNKRSFGILGMRERVAALKGKFDLQSFPGKGTWIEIMLPKHNHDSNQ
jgi:PAS domain S-box-containing protein